AERRGSRRSLPGVSPRRSGRVPPHPPRKEGGRAVPERRWGARASDWTRDSGNASDGQTMPQHYIDRRTSGLRTRRKKAGTKSYGDRRVVIFPSQTVPPVTQTGRGRGLDFAHSHCRHRRATDDGKASFFEDPEEVPGGIPGCWKDLLRFYAQPLA